MDEHGGQDGQVGPSWTKLEPVMDRGCQRWYAPGGRLNWTEWTGFVNGSTQLHPFGGARSKKPTGRVTGAPYFMHGPLCLHLGMLVHLHLWSICMCGPFASLVHLSSCSPVCAKWEASCAKWEAPFLRYVPMCMKMRGF